MPAATPGPQDGGSADAPLQHRLGRFRLLALEGKSRRSMAWRVHDPQAVQERLLLLPREKPIDAIAAERWEQAVRRGARLKHPQLAEAIVGHPLPGSVKMGGNLDKLRAAAARA